MGIKTGSKQKGNEKCRGELIIKENRSMAEFMDGISEKLRKRKKRIISVSCGLCKMDCKNCEMQKLIEEHNQNIENA